MDTAIEFYPNSQNPVFRCYQNTALDYFNRMGGAGRYESFQEWHSALLTLGCGLVATGEFEFAELSPIWSRLPHQIVGGCDKLRERVTAELIKALNDIEDKVRCVIAAQPILLDEIKHRYGDVHADHLKQPQHIAFMTAWGEAVGEMEALGVMENKHGVGEWNSLGLHPSGRC